MRKLNYLFLSALMTLCMVSFVSCSDDDDNDNNQLAKDIVGKWSLKSSVLNLDCEPKEATDPIKGYYTDEEGAYIYEFSADNKYIVTYTANNTEDDRGTYKVSGKNVELTSSIAIPKRAAEQPTGTKRTLTNVSVSGAQLSMTADLAASLIENAKDDNFWKEIEVAKPESFVVKKFTGVYTFSVTKEPK